MITSIGNDNKPRDNNRVQLFHRINSDQFDEKKDRTIASGRGYKCGCRSPKKDFLQSGVADALANGVVKVIDTLLLTLIPVVGPFLAAFKDKALDIIKEATGTDIEDELAKLLSENIEGFLFASYLKSIPAWVPVDRKEFGPNFENQEGKEVEREVEGLLTRSFQTIRDTPFFQWTHWYKWSFQVRPIDGYAFMVGKGNTRNTTEANDLANPPTGLFEDSRVLLEEATDINVGDRAGHSMECLWDVGAFTKPPGNFANPGERLPGVMFHPNWPFWPMTNDYFWAAGRWVYDCTHTTSLDKDGNNEGVMPTMLHPCKAIAFARYEGFKFDENEKSVPAVRFLFWACRKGGYLNLGEKDDKAEQDDTCAIKFNDKDYEFIVDLPDPPVADIAWPIGHTPDFPANALVLRPRLLMKIDFAPFGVPGDFFPDFFQFDKAIDPIVELLTPENPQETPNQVRIKIPLSQVPKDKDAYGVCISLGWFDGDGTLADGVKKVAVQLNTIRFLVKTGELYFKICINGRWFYGPFHDASDKIVSLAGDPGDKRLTLFLPDDGVLRLSTHGMKRRGFGESFEKNDEKRKLFVGGIFRTPEELRRLLAQNKKVITDVFGQAIDSDFVKDLLDKGLDDLLTGKRREVQWKKDIDQDKKEIASAVAREMFITLPAIFNRQNEPLGMVEPIEASMPQPSVTINDNAIRMAKLVKNLKASGQKQFSLNWDSTANRIDVVGDAQKLAFHLEGVTRTDYEMKCVVKVESQ